MNQITEAQQAGLEVLKKIRILSPKAQVKQQLADLSCDDLRMLLRYYGCSVHELGERVYRDKIGRA